MSTIILRTWFKNQETAIKMYTDLLEVLGRDKCPLTLHTDYTAIDPRSISEPDIYTKRGFTSRVVLSYNHNTHLYANMTHHEIDCIQKVFILVSEALKGYLQMSFGGSDFRLVAKTGTEKKAFNNETIDIITQAKLKNKGIKVKTY